MLMHFSTCQLARQVAEHERLCMINGDIIILDVLYKALKRVRLTQFVAVGRTYNLKIHGEIDFNDANGILNCKTDLIKKENSSTLPQ